jgi:hypothetical protein
LLRPRHVTRDRAISGYLDGVENFGREVDLAVVLRVDS